jgi:hypothetical protein
MFLQRKTKTKPYYFAYHIDNDHYTIMKNGNWFMVIHVNGEILPERQIMHVEYLIDQLNKNYKG